MRKRAVSSVVPEPMTRVCRHAEFGRKMRRQMGHDIDGICHDQQNRVGRVREDGRDDLPKDFRVPLQQLQARFARFLGDPSGNNHDLRAGQIRIIARAHGQWMRERNCMLDIVGFSLGASPIQIDQHDFPAHAAHDQSVSRGGPDHAAANNANFHNASPQ